MAVACVRHVVQNTPAGAVPSAAGSRLVFLAASVVATLTAAPLPAQDTLPPELGRYVHSLGLPAVLGAFLDLLGRGGATTVEAEAAAEAITE